MEIQAMRPVWASTGEQLLTELDVLHAQIASLQTRRLQAMAAIDDLGYAKDIGATDTVRLVAFRHRLDTTAVRHDLKLAKALPRYAIVSAALPDPTSPQNHYDNDSGWLSQDDQSATEDTADPNQHTGPTAGSDIGDRSENAETGEQDHNGANPNADGHHNGATTEQGADPAGEAGPLLLHPAQADAIVSALEQIPTRANVPVENLQSAEAQMVEAARHLSPKDLRMLGATVRDRLDTDGPEPAEDKAAAKEALWLKSATKGVRFG
jgi:Domain of unknown function (DUF222)